jgi:hypothetical protein
VAAGPKGKETQQKERSRPAPGRLLSFSTGFFVLATSASDALHVLGGGSLGAINEVEMHLLTLSE